MGLFSFLRKNKQESTSGESDGEFYSRSEQETGTARGRGRRRQTSQESESVDPVLPEKKRARRRLVGAVALVLAAIIGLPMILDSEPRPLADDIAIQIPSKDKSLPAGDDRRAAPAVPAAPPIPLTPAPKASVAAGPDKEVIEPSTASAKPRAIPQPATPDQKPALKPEPTALSQSRPAEKSNSANDPARAYAILDGKTDVKLENSKVALDKKPGKFVLQVAALGSQEKVNELQHKLKAAGIKSYTQKVATESGQRIRVRVGPFGSKEEAEKIRAKLGQLGLNGSLVPA
jgi:DedD protein